MLNRWLAPHTSICVVGALTLAIGVAAALGVVVSVLLGAPHFDLSFVLIWIGLGLLRGSSLQRGLFGGLLAFVVLGLVLVFVVMSWQEFSGGRGGPQSSWPFLIFLVGIFGSLIFILKSSKNDSWFSQKFSGKAPDFVISVTVVLTLVFSGLGHLKDYEREQAFAKVFRYDFDLIVRDAETGASIERVTLGHNGGDFGSLKVPDWMKRSSSGMSGKDGVAWEISGYSRQPVQVNVSKEGYQPASVEITRYTESPLEFDLQPVTSK